MKRDDWPALAQAPQADAAWQALRVAACVPYRKAGRWAWHWAQGKLARDPAFRAVLERGHLPARARVLDIGCGQGLLASLLQACADADVGGAWPAGWPPAPMATAYTGIELMARDADRARTALQALPLRPHFVCDDMRRAEFPASDLVVILDVLHYVDHAAQQRVLERVRDALRPSNGRLLLRVGDAERRREFAVTRWVDRVVTSARGHRVAPTFGRPLADWTALLGALGFHVRAEAMSRGTPFANVLLIADLGRDRVATAR